VARTLSHRRAQRFPQKPEGFRKTAIKAMARYLAVNSKAKAKGFKLVPLKGAN
jgi:hypothetical protein